MARKLEVEIIGDASSLEKAFGKASRSGSGLSRGLKSLGKVAAVGVGAAFAGMAVTVTRGTQSLARMEKISAQTDAAIKSTGRAANVTRKEILDYSDQLEKTTSVEAETIQEGQNLLLTFTKIRNEVGKGNDIFDQATLATLNLSVAMGKDMSSSAILVGKALNDPLKGVTALTRAGVQLTEQQKASIKGFVEQGNTMAAQKIILGELTTQFGKSGEALGDTMAGRLAILKHRFGEIEEAIAAKLLPVLERLMAWTERNWPTIEKVITTAFAGVQAAIRFIGPLVGTLIGWFQRLADFSRRHWGEVEAAAARVLAWYRGTLAPAIENVLTAITAFWDRFGKAITRIVLTSFGVLATVVKTAMGNIASVINVILAVLRGDWSKAWAELKEIPVRTLKGIVAVISGLASMFFQAMRAIGAALIDGIVAGLSGLADAVKNKITSGIRSALDGVKGAFGIGSPSKVTADELGGPLAEGIIVGLNAILGSKLSDEMRTKIESAIDAATQAIASKKGALSSAFDSLVSSALSAFDKLSSEIETKTEKKIRLQDERRAAQDRQQALTGAQGELATAMAGGDTAAILAAQQAVADAEFAIRRASDEKKAAQERKALENRRALQRKHFEEELAAVNAQLQRGHLTREQANERLIKLFKKYEIPFKKAALALGSALAEGLRESLGLVGKMAQAVRDEILKHLSHIQVRINIDVTAPDKPSGRQHGGPVRSGTPYVVGERGPELFVPNGSGRIISNSAMTGGSGGSVIHLNFYGPAVGTSREFQDLVRRALYDVSRRNPALAI